MVEMKSIAKWGFGMAPISKRMQFRYDHAVQTVLDLMNGNITLEEVDLDAISELKGMFNRCIRQDQWDWFSVYTELGEPSRESMLKIVSALKEIRRSVTKGNTSTFDRVKHKLIESNLLHYLYTYQSDISDHIGEPEAGWIYILSTREQPDILKIGMTRRSVAQRVKEINASTGVLIPFAARRVFRVLDVGRAEKEIFERLSQYRIRPDREFFKLTFPEAASLIEHYIAESTVRYRHHGTVLWYDQDKCYGFISVKGLDDIFVHSSQIPKAILPQIVPGTMLEFDLRRRPQGLCALDASLVTKV